MADTSRDAAYVRQGMIGQRTPPVADRGAIRWLRENLFSSPLNAILTILGALAVWYMLSGLVPWLLRSVWDADSLAECRAIVQQRYGEGVTGACWAMVRARWHQYIFGFYPPALYWRPVLAFALMFFAIAPLLFADNRRARLILLSAVTVLGGGALFAVVYGVAPRLLGAPVENGWLPWALSAALIGLLGLAAFRPRAFLGFVALYPVIAYWLLWGGSVWGPVCVLLGFVLLALVYRLLSPHLGAAAGAGAAVVAAVVWWLALQGYVSGPLQAALPAALESVNSDRFGGFLLSITIGVTAIAGSLPLSILLALGRQSDMLIVKTLSVGFIEFIRGVPLITLLFTASLLLQYFLPPRTNFDIILRVIILVTLFAAAYLAEVIRGGLAALPRGQYEAADSLGLDYWRAQRLIIMPQALKISIPGIVSTFIGLFKDTTLVSLVGLLDPLRGVTSVVRADIAWKGIYWEPYILVGTLFFVICFGMSRYSMALERRLQTDHR